MKDITLAKAHAALPYLMWALKACMWTSSLTCSKQCYQCLLESQAAALKGNDTWFLYSRNCTTLPSPAQDSEVFSCAKLVSLLSKIASLSPKSDSAFAVSGHRWPKTPLSIGKNATFGSIQDTLPTFRTAHRGPESPMPSVPFTSHLRMPSYRCPRHIL